MRKPTKLVIEAKQRQEDIIKSVSGIIHNLQNKKVKSSDRVEERLREQIQFRDNYITEVLQVLNKSTSKAELVEAKKYANVQLENSYIELDNSYGVL